MNGNTIQRIFIDLQYNGRIDGLSLQKEITDWCNNSLLISVETELERYNVGDFVKIDQLELDISVGDRQDWMKKLLQKIREEIGRKLHAILNQTGAQGEEKELSPSGHFFETFIYFLRKGHLPWWSEIKSKDAFLSGFQSFITTPLQDNMVGVLQEALKEDAVQQRTVYELPNEDFFKLISALYPHLANVLFHRATNILSTISRAGVDDSRAAFNIFKKSLLKQIDETDPSKANEKTVQAFVQELSVQNLLHVLQPDKPGLSSSGRQIEVKPVSSHEKDAGRKDVEDGSGKKYDEFESIYVSDAGLVIIAAFLPAFFKKTGIMSKERITDHNLAACLLQYLLAAKEDIAEFELGVTKILCGLEMEDPVDTGLRLTEEQKAEANEVLLSVIDYWSILKDTTADGLRESFLQRKGKLTFVSNEWLLQVEQKGYDMLLRDLPWNIQMIKLPWMKYLLRTEWVF